MKEITRNYTKVWHEDNLKTQQISFIRFYFLVLFKDDIESKGVFEKLILKHGLNAEWFEKSIKSMSKERVEKANEIFENHREDKLAYFEYLLSSQVNIIFKKIWSRF